jgi:PAS domain S-box-containing protein
MDAPRTVMSAPRTEIVRYLVATLAVAVALALRVLLAHVLVPTVFLLFFGAVMVSAWYGGTGPGLYSTVLSLLVSGLFLIPVTVQPPLRVSQAMFILVGVLISVLSGTLHTARRRAIEAQQVSERAQRETDAALERARAGAVVENDLRARLAAVVESSDDAIMTVDAAGRIASWNVGAERMFGYAANEVIGQPAQIIAPADRLEESQGLVQTVLRGDRVAALETVRVGKGARRVEVSLAATPLRDADGKVAGGAAILRDISRRKRDEEEIRHLNRDLERRVRERTRELEAANDELKSFTYSVSHDLRAPLRGLDGFSRILLEDYGDRLDDEGRRHLETVRASALKMGALIDDLLRLSRLTRHPLEKERIDVEALVREVLEELRSEREGRQVEFEIAALPPVEADRGLLHQVFVNLISNAIKYTRPRAVAHVEIGSCPDPLDPRTLCYFVRDDGVGFDMRYAGKLFGVFQRMHREQEYEGTGVGLAIVSHIVNRHGGRIWPDARPDHGATFSFTLGHAPAVEAAEPAL